MGSEKIALGPSGWGMVVDRPDVVMINCGSSETRQPGDLAFQ